MSRESDPLPTIECPTCGSDTPIGLPRNATVRAVLEPDGDPPDVADDEVCREVSCSDGHRMRVCFRR